MDEQPRSSEQTSFKKGSNFLDDSLDGLTACLDEIEDVEIRIRRMRCEREKHASLLQSALERFIETIRNLVGYIERI